MAKISNRARDIKFDINLSASQCARRNTHGEIHPTVFVVHTSESKNIPNTVNDIRGMYQYLCRTPEKLWVHYACDMDGYLACGAYIRQLCFHARGGNGYTNGCELIGSAATTRKEWLTTHRVQLRRLTELLAWWSIQTGVPLRKSSKRGVCGHSSITPAERTDPGKGFPWWRVIRDARYYKKHGVHLPYKRGGLG